MKQDKLFRGRPKGVVVFGFVLFLTALFWLDNRHTGQLTALRLACWQWFGPVQKFLDAPLVKWRALLTELRSYRTLYADYRALEAKQQYLAAQVAQFNVLQAKYQELAELVTLVPRASSDVDDVNHSNATVETGTSLPSSSSKWRIVQLLSLPQAQFGYRFMLNAGRAEGVAENQMVLTATGAVGRIDTVTQQTAVVLPLISPDSIVAVKIARNGQECFCAGSKDQQLELLNATAALDIRVGDQLVTSDLGGGWQAGYQVGTVREIQNLEGQHFLKIQVTPAVNCWQITKVLILPQKTAL